MVNARESLKWGATVSAHAVEGADFHADWWRWEQRPAHVHGGATSEVAADHLRRYPEDVQLARKFGLNTLQYGISWARIQPGPDQFDEAALEHYRNVFQAMGKGGIDPIGVLQEHALPAWFSDQGAWEHPHAPDLFARYVAKVVEQLGDWCTHWIPIHEPLLALAMAYGEGRWPIPSRHSRQRVALAGIARAQQKAREVLKEACDANQVGLSIYSPQLFPLDPHSPWDERVAAQSEHWLLEALPALLGTEAGGSPPCCFVALSCPGTLGVHLAPWRLWNGLRQFEDATGKAAALDQACPDALAVVAMAHRIRQWGIPLLITGVGMATEDDSTRCTHLLDHVAAVLSLKEEGVPIMGFCYHTFLDGFGWHHGYRHRTGLVHVDRESLARTPNPSAFLYQDVIRNGAIRPGAVSRFAPEWTSAMEALSR